MNRIAVITIDGPAGAGKSTTARALAARVGGRVVDTGALYRAVAVALADAGVDPSDGDAVDTAVGALRVHARDDRGRTRVWADNRELTDRLRSVEAGPAASRVSARPAVRAALLDVQRQLAYGDGVRFDGADGAAPTGFVVAEGRDTGSVVFPDAAMKFFLTAGLEVRARRRIAELTAAPALDAMIEQIQARDTADTTRAIAPLVCPEGAVRIDTTGEAVESVVARMVSELTRAGLLKGDVT